MGREGGGGVEGRRPQITFHNISVPLCVCGGGGNEEVLQVMYADLFCDRS